MLHPLIGPTNILQLRKTGLRDDGPELPAGSRDTMRRRAVTRRENFSRYDKGCDIWSKVLEEIGEAVEEEEGLARGYSLRELVVAKAEDDKEHCEDCKSHELDRLATPAVNEEEGDPVSGDKARSR